MNSEKGVTLDYQDEDSQFNEELIQEDKPKHSKIHQSPCREGCWKWIKTKTLMILWMKEFFPWQNPLKERPRYLWLILKLNFIKNGLFWFPLNFKKFLRTAIYVIHLSNWFGQFFFWKIPLLSKVFKKQVCSAVVCIYKTLNKADVFVILY